MTQLIINEWQKVFSRKSNIIIMVFIVGISAFFSFIPLLFNNEQAIETNTYGENWQSEVSQQVQTLQEEAETIRSQEGELSFSDSIIASTNEGEVQRLSYHLDKDIEPPATNNFFDNLVGASSLNALIGIFVTIIASAMVSKEFNMGTIKLLLIRTQSRSKILTSKYVTTLLLSLFYYGLLYLSITLFALFTTDMNPTSEYVFMTTEGLYDHTSFISYFAGLVASNLVYLVIIASLAFMLSTLTRNTTIALGGTLGAIFLGAGVTNFLVSKTELAKYLITANWSLEKYLPGRMVSIDGLTLPFSIIVNVVYVCAFVGLSYYVFNKQDVLS
ncbi:MAG: ABC transporter permease [Alkalibacterium gilvum]|uniref:ABC-2 type transport system permease protein n=1 Tax=Alkalibacterium gilvum TaxID=1130080 RepID=A0A1H6SLL0_9LACT|nr:MULTISPECIES: ABC transporter permease subunit [Alkalibacterium]MDN6293767.1 ABC transporter permease [Alkalibacterium sp.]MDN6295649.1 ABC transporter permease [Alkalibacterium sp.]MDN6398677.1 ABC transporter permease [Alkalibacterium sp.]SEI68783.1 ABC-2 type transport system permease protein [Alkalibacterium gilvum]